MAFSENLAERVRNAIPDILAIVEKKMMGGLVFMVDDKMCVGIIKNDLMVRFDAERNVAAVLRRECRPMDMQGKPMRNYYVITAEGLQTEEALAYWLDLALDFNKTVKLAKKRR